MKMISILNPCSLKAVLTFQALLILNCAGFLYADSSALVSDAFPLWSGEVPGEKGGIGAEKNIKKKTDDGMVRLTNVSHPTITVYRPGEGVKNTGAAVLVCPGGGYSILAMSHEGTEVCEWLSGQGVTAVLLKYRVPRREGLDKHHAPLQDAQRALSLIRKRAGEWSVDPKKIGVLGFSAGGHLATMLMSQHDNKRSYTLDQNIDAISCRPNFAILVYPAYLQDAKNPDKLAAGIVVNKNTPPVFLVAAHNDKAWAEGSAHLYIALKRAGIPAELHIFARGGHGFGMKKTGDRVAQWPQICEKWMRETGVLGD